MVLTCAYLGLEGYGGKGRKSTEKKVSVNTYALQFPKSGNGVGQTAREEVFVLQKMLGGGRGAEEIRGRRGRNRVLNGIRG